MSVTNAIVCQSGLMNNTLVYDAGVSEFEPHWLLHVHEKGLGQGPKKGLTEARSAVGFCLGSGLFGSYNSD